MALNNTLLDNSDSFRMLDHIRKILASGQYDCIKIATGFWDLPGTRLLQDELTAFLQGGGRLELLIGREPELRAYQERPMDDEERHRFPDFYIQRDINRLTDDYIPVAEFLLKYCDIEHEQDSPIQIRVYGEDSEKEQFLHAKCYIFLGRDADGQGMAYGIVGSSNFTEKGLQDNAELNYLETNTPVVTAAPSAYNPTKSHVAWFDEKWQQSVPWTGKFIREILSKAKVGVAAKKKIEEAVTKPLTPYELYIRLLQTRFGAIAERGQVSIEEYLPEGYASLDYQISAVKQCYSIMQTHGGFLLGDVVGLGKTVVGTMLIRYFLDFPDDRHEKKVLIVTPPAIKSAWMDTIKEFDEGRSDRIGDYVDFITTGSIDNILRSYDDEDELDDDAFEGELNTVNYGLILIDESHKFRSSQTQMYQALNNLISQIGSSVGDYPYVGLLSATPQNNAPDDLRNQIYLFERNRESCTLEKVPGRNLEAFFSTVSHNYWDARRDADDIVAHPEKYPNPKYAMDNVNHRIREISTQVRECVLSDLLVRRTRTDIKKYYLQDMDKQHIRFPKISGPHGLEYKMDDELARLFVDTMQVIAPSPDFGFDDPDYICYFRYRPIQFFVDQEFVRRYQGGNINVERYSRQLAKIMQTNLVKRLESSFAAFKLSLRNLRQYTQNMVDMWEHDAIFICPDIDVNAELDVRKNRKKDPKAPLLTFEQCAEGLRQKIAHLTADGRNERGRNAEYHTADFKPEYIELVRRDLALISDLCDRWGEYTEDPKLDVFRDSLKPVLMNPETNPAGKLVIFSEAKDTVEALRRTIEAKGYQGRVLIISAENRDRMEKAIKENFDANFKGEKRNDYDIIVTTEVLAEGINLHRANVILNYDTPWNSTRLMQRIGRVNRIGTTADTVYVYNFFPSAQGNEMIQLVQKAYIKLQSFHILFGEDSKVFSEAEEVEHYDLDTEVNGPESPYEKYVYLLRKFREENPERYEFIKNADKDLEQAVATNGCAYFLVRTEKMSGLYVKVWPEGRTDILFGSDMFREFEPDVDAKAVDLPIDWEEKKKAAVQAFGQYISRLNIQASKNEPATRAKGIIAALREKDKISTKSKNLLRDAGRIIRKGNTDLIRKVNRINDILNEGDILFTMSQEEIDAVISDALERIVEAQKKIDGTPYVLLGLAK